MCLMHILHDIILGDGAKSLSFEINAHYLELCDHEESSSMWFFVYEETKNYEFYRHEQYMLKDVTFCMPKSSLLDSWIRGTHDESVMLHEFSFGTYMEHETLKCFGRCIVHKSDKFKDYVHGLKISLLVHNFHPVHLVMKFVLKIQERFIKYYTVVSLPLYLISNDK